MAKDKRIQAVENVLRDYYKKRWKLNQVISQIHRLNEDIEEIKYRINEGINVLRIPNLTGASYDSIKAAGHSNEGLEKTMIELEEMLDKLRIELAEKIKKRNSLEMKKRALEEEIFDQGIECCFKTMSEIEINVLEQRFVYRRNFIGSGKELHMDESTVRYWYNKAIERLIENLAIA